MASGIVLATVLILPVVIALARSRRMDVAAFVFNAGHNSETRITASVICGNIGIGTFVAIFLFTRASPIIGISIAAAYTMGLVLCAIVARRIHEASARVGAHGLVDLIVETHNVKKPLLIWLPVAVVFMLRIMVQLAALALILAEAFGLPSTTALAAATLFSGCYVVIGGYRAATETDILHAAVILALMLFIGLSMPAGIGADRELFDLGPYAPILLVGIFLFLPFSAVLGIDNWQRIATATTAAAATRTYVVGAVVCGATYATIVAVALLPDAQTDVLGSFRALMPTAAPWLADLLFACAIISTIDTFMVPLTTTFARQGMTLGQLRLLVGALFGVVAVLTGLMGDLLTNIIAAFNSLAVFLPAVCGALLLRHPRPGAAIASMSVGVSFSLILTAIDVNSAAPVGFVMSAVIYWMLQRSTAGQPSAWLPVARQEHARTRPLKRRGQS
jgi:SSS family solute:Na+ symporter